MEDARRRATDEKVLRIDHSDVYLENDRLSEELGKSLDTIFRAKHRTVINHVYEMRQLRRSLNAAASRNPRTISSVTALRPHTSPMYIRTRAPRVVKLDVHVPSAHAHADSLGSHPHSRPNTHERSRSSNNVSDDDDDDNDEDEDEESEDNSDDVADEKAAGRVSRRVLSGHAAGRSGLSTKDQTAETPVPKKVSRQQKLLEFLNLTKVPEAWFTDVVPASGPTSTTRRVASANPFMTTGNNRVSDSRRRHSRTGNPRTRGAKSHSVRKEGLSAEESTLVCGGDPDGDCRGTGLRSRRQLMELSGLAASEDETDADYGQRRTELLEAVRLERQRLDARVKLFLKSCDLVHVGGISSRKERQYSRIFLREVLNT